MARNERKTRTKRAIFAAIALLLVAYLISSTYARYSTEGKATGTIQVAKWAVVMKADDGTTLESTTQPITFTVQKNTNVVPGKIAPAVTAVAEVELDLAGTEVAVDFDAVIDQSAIATLGASSDKLTLDVKVDGKTYTSGTSQTINLIGNSAFTSTNGKKKVTLTLTWDNEDPANNPDDTTMGEAAPTLEIPVTLTAKQHIDA